MNVLKQTIILTANIIVGQLWGKEGKEMRNFFIFHLLNLLWFFGEIFGTILFHPFLMIWLITILFLFIPEYRAIGFVLVAAYAFAIIAMRVEANRYYYKDQKADVVAGDKEMKTTLRLKYCKYSGYRIKGFGLPKCGNCSGL
jgi:hypothetical protein